MRRMASTKDALRKTTSAVMLLLLLLPMFWAVSNPNSNGAGAAVTSQKAPDQTLTVNPITNGNFTGNANGWTFTTSGNNPTDMTGAYTSSGYTGGGVYARLYRGSRQAVGDWYQDWSYSGTVPPDSAWVTFRWRCNTYSYAGSNNTVSVYIKPPGGSLIKVWSQAFYSTSSWSALQWVNIKSLITSTGTYRIMLRFYGTTGSYSYAQVQVRWDDVGIPITYTVTTPPTGLSIVINNGATYTNKTSATLNLAATGATEMRFSNDNVTYSGWEPFSVTKSWTLASGNGLKTVYFEARNAGGQANHPASDQITYDESIPPAPTGMTPTNGTATNINTPTLTWGEVTDAGAPASGVANYTLQLDTSPSFGSGNLRTVTGLTGTSSYVASPLSDGTWYWRVRAIDNAGNLGSWSATNYFIVIDIVDPNVPTLVSPTSGSATKDSTPVFDWDAPTDPPPSSGIANYTLQLDTSSSFSSGNLKTINVSTATSYTLTTSLSDGTWYWRVRAIDNATNAGSFSGYWSIVVDTVAPTQPSLLSPADGANTNDTTPDFSWAAATDATSGIASYELNVDTTSLFNSGNLRNFTGLTSTSFTVPSGKALSVETTWYWRVRANDTAGNTGSYSTFRSMLVDITAPTQPSLSSPADGGSTTDSTPDFSWSAATDTGSLVASYSLQLDTSNAFSTINLTTIAGIVGTSHTVTTPLGDDVWFWRVRAVDYAGNWGSWSTVWNVTVYTTVSGAPFQLSPVNSYITNNNFTAFEWTEVTMATYDLYIDRTPDFNSGDLFTKTGLLGNYTLGVGEDLDEGTWYWKVIAQPGLKNSTIRSIVIDTKKPNAPVLSSPGDAASTNDNTTTLTWNPASDPSPSSGIANYTLQLDTSSSFNNATGNLRIITGLTGTSYTIPGGLPLADGPWYWRVNATDEAGNKGSYSGYWNFTVDTQLPTGLTMLLVGGDYTNSLTVTLSITASGAQNMSLSNDGVSWVEYKFNSTKSWTLTAGDGAKHVYFKCRDAAWNWAYLPSGFISITLDTVPPTAGSPYVPVFGFLTGDNKTAFQWLAGSDVDGSGVVGYSLQLDTTTTFSSTNMTSIPVSNVTSHTLTTALQDGTWYWRINATDRAGNTGYYSAYSSFTISTIPPEIVSQSGLQPTNDSLLNLVSPQFRWDPANRAYKYHIQIDRDLSFATLNLIENLTLSSTAFSPSVDNNKTLTDGTWYWRVEAISLAGAHSGYSIVRTLTVDVTPPVSPLPISPPESGATNVRYHTPFKWSEVQDAVSYWFQLDFTPDFNSSVLITYTGIAGNSCVVDALLSDAYWYWRVVALDLAGNVGSSLDAPTIQFMIDTVSPSPPVLQSPAPDHIGNQTTPTLTWYTASDPLSGGVHSGVADYTLWLDNSSTLDSSNLKTITGLTTTNYTVASSLGDGTWYWFVNATDRAGNTGEGSVTQSFTIDTVAPAPPPILSMHPNGVSVDVSKVTLSWNPSSDSSGISGYFIQIDISDKFDSTDHHYEYTIDSPTTTYTPVDEFSNGQWYWRIAALDAAGNRGAWSEPVPFSVNIAGGLNPMMVLLAGGGSTGATVLAVLGYVLYRRAKIPFVVKKIDQSIKLIGKGEMPPAVPMRSRAELVQNIFRDKVAILSKERIEEFARKKGKKEEKEPKKLEEPSEKEAPVVKPKGVETKPKESEAKPRKAKAVAPSEAEEADVDMIVRELEKLESKEGMEPSEESEFMKREREEAERAKKKRD